MNRLTSAFTDPRRGQERVGLLTLMPERTESATQPIKNGKSRINRRNLPAITNSSIQMLLIGLCLGVTVGIAFVPIFDINFGCASPLEMEAKGPDKLPKAVTVPTPESQVPPQLRHLPRDEPEKVPTVVPGSSSESVKVETKPINPHKKNDSSKAKKEAKLKRPRYFSTELGLRRKLIAGIIVSNPSNLENTVEINRTMSQQVDKFLIFVGGPKAKESVRKLRELGLPGVIEILDVGLNSSARDIFVLNKVAIKVIKFLGDKFSEDFDHVFITLDQFYIHGGYLMESVGKISVSQDFMWGVSRQNICALENGFVITRRLIQKLTAKIDRCLTNSILGANNGFARCIGYILNGRFLCESLVQGQSYLSVSGDSGETEFDRAITIGPLSSSSEFKRVHEIILKTRLALINTQIVNFQHKIQLLKPKLPLTYQTSSWPPGVSEGFSPKTRFDILRWTYFDGDNIMYFPNDKTAMKSSEGVDRLDLNHIRYASLKYILAGSTSSGITNKEKGGSEEALVPPVNASALICKGGYRRFNPTRGMEYLLDFADVNTGEKFRVQGLRPLCRTELVPMPFVTENQRVTILVPLGQGENMQQVKRFLDRFFNFTSDRKLNTVVIFMFLTEDNVSSSKRSNSLLDSPLLTSQEKKSKYLNKDEVAEVQKLISQYNKKIPKKFVDRVKAGYVLVPLTKKKSLVSALLSAIESVIRRIMGTSALILTADVYVNFKDDFLNRVRMNTILNWQVFSPIPFVEYNPAIYQGKNNVGDEMETNKEIEVNRKSGYFGHEIFRYFSFYASDFLTARKLSIGNRTSFDEFTDLALLPNLFIRFSNLHFFRGSEPSLQVPFSFPSGCFSFKDCVKTTWGSRAQLAKIILNSSVQKQKNA